MMNIKGEQLLSYAKRHGFKCWLEGDTVYVQIPWTGPNNSTGETTYKAKTLGELRDVLGY